MSLTATAAGIALLLSLLPLILIGYRDPKRLRSRRGGAVATLPLARRPRQLLTALVLAPGVLLIGSGLWPALLIWLGALIALGWALVLLLARSA
ncbi:MAG: hypothetical protein NTW01_01795 [Gammaproteobacteria bacterium]|nr:hypothetical protein [Gammaproteobacteria bacterium]